MTAPGVPSITLSIEIARKLEAEAARLMTQILEEARPYARINRQDVVRVALEEYFAKRSGQ